MATSSSSSSSSTAAADNARGRRDSENVIVEYVELDDFLMEHNRHGSNAVAVATASNEEGEEEGMEAGRVGEAAASTKQKQGPAAQTVGSTNSLSAATSEVPAAPGRSGIYPPSGAGVCTGDRTHPTTSLLPVQVVRPMPMESSPSPPSSTKESLDCKERLKVEENAVKPSSPPPPPPQQQQPSSSPDQECSNLQALAQAAAAAAERQQRQEDDVASGTPMPMPMPQPQPTAVALALAATAATAVETGPSATKRRRPRRPIPDERKDEKYWKRRMKNNAAAQRSREAKREKENRMSLKAALLEREYQVLVSEVEKARDLNRELRERLSKYEEC